MDTTKPLVVTGAGPAGLAAAITLARAGRRVEVRELHRDVGARFHGNLQLLTNYPDNADSRDELTSVLGDVPIQLWPQTTAFLSGPAGLTTQGKSETPFGYLLQRGSGERMLDGALKKAAEDAGVAFHFGARASENEADIAATGGATPQGVAREWYGQSSLPDGFHVLFDNRICPAGFAYLLVAEGHTVIGAAVVRRLGTVNDAFRAAVRWFHEHAGAPLVEKPTHSGALDFFLPQDTPPTARPLFVGEAGGFADALFGFGIRIAIQSGVIAANCLLSGEDFNAARRRMYGSRFEVALANRFLFETGGHLAYRWFLRRAADADFRDYGCALYSPTPTKRALAAVARMCWQMQPDCAHGARCAWCRKREG